MVAGAGGGEVDATRDGGEPPGGADAAGVRAGAEAVDAGGPSRRRAGAGGRPVANHDHLWLTAYRVAEPIRPERGHHLRDVEAHLRDADPLGLGESPNGAAARDLVGESAARRLAVSSAAGGEVPRRQRAYGGRRGPLAGANHERS